MTWFEIPQLTKAGQYRVNVSWGHLEWQLSEYAKCYTLQVEPEFQRAHVWSDDQRSRYVEYVLRGGKSSRVLYWNCPVFGQASSQPGFNTTIMLVDGLQRLTAVRKFLADEITAFGLRKSEFEGSIPTLGYMDFVFEINDLSTYSQVLQWYLDLNAGGIAHTSKELDRVRKLLEAQL